jgi:hypothetical protein
MEELAFGYQVRCPGYHQKERKECGQPMGAMEGENHEE